MAINPIDDIFKIIAKQLQNQGNKKARYELLKKTKNIATSGASKISAKPKVKPKPKPKGVTTISGKPVGKIARTTPARPKRDYYTKGKSVAQTNSEKRAAERMANRMLKRDGFNVPKSKPSGNAKPVDVRGSIIQPPSKATMRPPTPRGSKAYEANLSKAQEAADRLKFGRGQKPPKGGGKPKPPKGGSGGSGGVGGVKVKPKPKTPSGAGGATATAKRLQDELKNATTPAQRLAAKKKLMNHILTTGNRRSKNIYK